jgi:hypothetical protein
MGKEVRPKSTGLDNAAAIRIDPATEQKQNAIIAALGPTIYAPTAFSSSAPPSVLTSIYTLAPSSDTVVSGLIFTGDASAEVQVSLDSVVVLYGRIGWSDRVFSALMNLQVSAGTTLDISVVHRESLTHTYKGSIHVQS